MNIQINRGTRAPTRKIWKSVAIEKKKKYFVFLRKQGTEEKTDLHMALGYGDTPISLSAGKTREGLARKGGNSNYSVPNYRAPRACRADRHKINTRVPFFLLKSKKRDAAERPSARGLCTA